MGFIQLRDICLKQDNKLIFHNFNLSVERGEKLQIAGKSGSGKSTLLKILLGFQNIDSGQIIFEGNTVEGKAFTELRQNFAYVDQAVSLPSVDVKSLLKTISQYKYNNYNGEFDEGLAKLFEFDLNLLNKNTDELSGGERQRLGIIIAVMLNRPAFLLDEATSALDHDLKIKIAQYFANVSQTVVIVSHDDVWGTLGNFRRVELHE